jgi:hypothetical protein
VQTSFNIAFISFIQTDLSEAALDFVEGQIRRLRHALYSGGLVSFGAPMDVH